MASVFSMPPSLRDSSSVMGKFFICSRFANEGNTPQYSWCTSICEATTFERIANCGFLPSVVSKTATPVSSHEVSMPKIVIALFYLFSLQILIFKLKYGRQAGGFWSHRLVGLGRRVFIPEIRGSNPLGTASYGARGAKPEKKHSSHVLSCGDFFGAFSRHFFGVERFVPIFCVQSYGVFDSFGKREHSPAQSRNKTKPNVSEPLGRSKKSVG